MNDWDEQALREINSLEAARLAIRGALATIRDLQDQNGRMKAHGEAALQEESGRRKALESRVKELSAQVERWQEQAQRWEAENKKRDREGDAFRASVRAQVRAEERAEIERGRLGLEENLARLQLEMQGMAAAQTDKERRWTALRETLEKREAELLASEHEKLEVVNRARHDAELIERMRQGRDREIAASIRSRELEVEDKAREIAGLRRAVDELKKTQAASAADLELTLRDREEALAKAYREKEQAVVERYAKREMELQGSWSELENGLWKRAKDARDKLDGAANAQFDERARALADRSREVEGLLEARRHNLDEEFKRRCDEAEARYSQNEKQLAERWAEKEKRFLHQYELELTHEKALAQDEWLSRIKTLEAEHALRASALDRRAEDLEAEHRHQTDRLLEDAARKDAERLRQADDALASRTAELEGAFARRGSEFEDQSNALRQQLLDEHKRAVEGESASLQAQYEQRVRANDEAFAAKTAEAERARQALEEQTKAYKAGLQAEHLQRQKALDARWASREQELVRGYETALEQQRLTFSLESQKIKEDLELQRRRSELAFAARENAVKDGFSRTEAELKAAGALHADALRAQHQASLDALRLAHQEQLKARGVQAETDVARLRGDHESQTSVLRERHETSAVELRRQAADRDELVKRHQAEAAAAAAALDSARLAQAEREKQREDKFQQLERALHELWSRRETEMLTTHQVSLETQHKAFLADLGRRDETGKAAFEQWKTEAAARLEAEKTDWTRRQQELLAADRQRLVDEQKLRQDALDAEGLERKAEWGKQELLLRQRHDVVVGQSRADLDAQLRAREQALQQRFAAQEKELADLWSQQQRDGVDAARARLAERAAALDKEAQAQLTARLAELETAQVQAASARQASAEQELRRRLTQLEEQAHQEEKALLEREASLQQAYLRRASELAEAFKAKEAQLLERLASERQDIRLHVTQGAELAQGEAQARLQKLEADLKAEAQRQLAAWKGEADAERERLIAEARLQMDAERQALRDQLKKQADSAVNETRAREAEFNQRRAGVDVALRQRMQQLELEARKKEDEAARRHEATLNDERAALDATAKARELELRKDADARLNERVAAGEKELQARLERGSADQRRASEAELERARASIEADRAKVLDDARRELEKTQGDLYASFKDREQKLRAELDHRRAEFADQLKREEAVLEAERRQLEGERQALETQVAEAQASAQQREAALRQEVERRKTELSDQAARLDQEREQQLRRTQAALEAERRKLAADRLELQNRLAEADTRTQRADADRETFERQMRARRQELEQQAAQALAEKLKRLEKPDGA